MWPCLDTGSRYREVPGWALLQWLVSLQRGDIQTQTQAQKKRSRLGLTTSQPAGALTSGRGKQMSVGYTAGLWHCNSSPSTDRHTGLTGMATYPRATFTTCGLDLKSPVRAPYECLRPSWAMKTQVVENSTM